MFKFRALRMSEFFPRKPDILSSRMTVRRHIPWHYRLLIIVGLGGFLLLLSWGIYEAVGRTDATQHEIVQNEELDQSYNAGTCLQTKRQQLCMQQASLVRQLQISTTTTNDLASQVISLADENSQLKEKLSFFQHLTSGNTKNDAGISIHHLSLQKGQAPNEYRYTLSLIQGGERPGDFSGNLRFLVNLQQNDQTKTVPLTNKQNGQDFSINFKFFHRLEKSFKVPPDTIVESLQVQVFEKNNTEAKLTQTVESTI